MGGQPDSTPSAADLILRVYFERMNWSRRDLAFLLPVLAAAQTSPKREKLPSATFRLEDIPARQSGPILMRQLLNGDTHSGFLIDLHETELPTGDAPHASHHHVHEELLIVREGLLEVSVGERTVRLGPGGVGYFASNQEHGWKNVGKSPAKYFVMALGEDKA